MIQTEEEPPLLGAALHYSFCLVSFSGETSEYRGAQAVGSERSPV